MFFLVNRCFSVDRSDILLEEKRKQNFIKIYCRLGMHVCVCVCYSSPFVRGPRSTELCTYIHTYIHTMQSKSLITDSIVFLLIHTSYIQQCRILLIYGVGG